jgi:hypothetical protein
VVGFWIEAETFNNVLAEYARSKAVLQLTIQLFRVLGGSAWGRAELFYHYHLEGERPPLEDLGEALASKPADANRFTDHWIEVAAAIANQKQADDSRALSEIACEKALSSNPLTRQMEEVALRLATGAMPLPNNLADEARKIVGGILEGRTHIARNMRFLAIAVPEFLGNPEEVNWDWK